MGDSCCYRIDALARLLQFTEAADLTDVVHHKNDSVRNIAIEALAHRAELTLLLGCVHDKDQTIRRNAVRALAKVGQSASPHATVIIELLRHSDRDVRCAAAQALPKVGDASDAAAAASELIRDGCEDAVKLGKEILSGLQDTAVVVELLCDKDPNVHCAAVTALQEFGAAGARLVAAVVECFRDSHDVVRYAAIATFFNITAPSTSQATPTAELLRDKDDRVCPLSFEETLAQNTSVSLAELIHDKNKKVSCAAVNALARLGEAAAPHASAVAQLLSDNHDLDICRAAIETLPELGDEVAPHAAQAMVKFLHNSDCHVRLAAVTAMAKLGEAAAAPHATAVVELLRVSDENVCCAAIALLLKLGAAAEPHIAAMVELLRDPTRLHVQRTVAEALPKLGQIASLQVAAGLAQLLGDEDKAVRDCAFRVVQRIIPKLGETVVARVSTSVAELLRSTNTGICSVAINVMRDLGEAAAPHSMAMVALLRNADITIRFCALQALANLGKASLLTAADSRLHEDLDIRHALLDFISLKNSRDRLLCVQALSKLGLAECLVRFLEDRQWNVRLATLGALSALGHAAAPHTAAMAKLLNDKDAKVRCAAAEAVSSIEKTATPHTAAVVAAMVKLLGTSLKRLDHVPLHYFDERRDPASIRIAAFGVLSKLGKAAAPHTAGMVTAMVELLDYEFGYGTMHIVVRLAAVSALTTLGSAAEPHAAAMLKAITYASSDERLCLSLIKTKLMLGLEALSRFGLTSVFVPYVQNENRTVRLAAIKALSEFGCIAAPHAAQMATLFHDADSTIRSSVIAALPKFGFAAQYVTIVAELLLDKDESVRRAAVVVLSDHGGVADVVGLFCDEDPKNRIAAVEAFSIFCTTRIGMSASLFSRRWQSLGRLRHRTRQHWSRSFPKRTMSSVTLLTRPCR